MNNDKLRQAGEKFREAAGLMCEWLSDQFEAITDVFSTMAKAGISTNDALDVLLTAHRAASRIREVPEGKSNNWLKMHGYPMKREVAGRYGRRKKHEISITENNKTSVECEGSEGRRRCEKPERAECTVQRSNSAGEFPAGSGSNQLQRDRGSHEPDRCEIHKQSTETGRMKRNQGGIARRRYSGGWPSRKK